MDCSDHSSISSSTPIKRSSTPKFSSSGTGTNENDQNYQQKGMNLQNSKKLMSKHFMSPTVSATSKAIAPKKKILAERNEISDTNIQKTSIFDNSEDSYSFNDDSSLKPYLIFQKTYPSPRPQFLRYNPNRRRKIVLEQENEVMEERIKRSNSGKDIFLPSMPCNKNEGADLVCGSEEGEKMDEKDEEVEEEENKGGFLRKVLKLMLVLFVLVLSTLYISSMNSNETSPALQAVEGFKDGYFEIHDHTYGTMRRLGRENFVNRIQFKEIVKLFGVGSYFLDGNMGLLKVNQTFIGKCIEEQREVIEDVYLVKVENISDNVGEVVELLQVGEMEIEVEKKSRNSILGEMAGLEAGESGDVCDHETTKTGEDFDQTVENSEFKEAESIDNLESLPMLSYAFQGENEVVFELVPEVINPGDDEDLEMVGSNEITNIENIADNAGLVFVSESMDNEITSSEILNFEAESDFEVLLVIGVTIVLALVASLVTVFHLKRKRNARKDSFPITYSCMNQSQEDDKCNSELPKVREEQIKRVKSGYEKSKELNQSRAPPMELLGEFSVVEISSSSFKSCGLRSSNMGEIEVNGISPSYEDLTPPKKMIKKEKMVVAMTPVRRSSRIRIRAITSP